MYAVAHTVSVNDRSAAKSSRTRENNSGEPSGFDEGQKVQRDQIEVSLTYGKGCSSQVHSLQEATFQEPLNHSPGIWERDFGSGDMAQKRHHK
jgi:hypothetical protein